MPDVRDSIKLEVVGAVSTGVKDRQVATQNGQVTSVDAYVGTAPTGADLIFQLRKNTTVVATVTITAGSNTVAKVDVADSATARFTSDDVLDINVTQVGSTVAGSDLDVSVAIVGL
jgi:hypothetical protein